jgi:transglutaminase-like putative cysteine protease
MKLEVSSELTYTLQSAGTVILNIHALRTQKQTVLEESLTIDPYIKTEELPAEYGENRLIRFDVTDTDAITITYKALVDNFCVETDHENQVSTPVSQLPAAVLPYLHPSRYCQSDKLLRFASSKFASIENPFVKVVAVTDWIYENVQYISGSTDSQTSAYDTVTELAGVCRDFAHLGIAICRALSIPARYFAGYAYQLVPQDFHACFEAFIGNDWVLFDATRLAPLNGMVKISTGRDAADSAVANLFGGIQFNSSNVNCELREDALAPVYYDASQLRGLSYK